MTDSIIGLAEKKKKKFIFFNLKQITGSIIGPAMAGPTGPFPTALRLQVYLLISLIAQFELGILYQIKPYHQQTLLISRQ